MPLSRRITAVVALIAATATLGLSACGSTPASADSTSSGSALSGVTLTLGGNDQGVWSELQASHALDGAPYTVNFTLFANQVQTSTALAAGSLDLGAMAQYSVIQTAAAATPAPWTSATAGFKTILETGQADPENYDRFGTVSSKDSGITTLTADAVRGKKWTASPGATNFLVYLQTLKHLGLTQSDVQYVQLDNAAGALALLNNQVDLASGAYSSYTAAVADGGHNLDSSTEVGPGSPGGLQAATASLDDPQKEAAIRDFVARYINYKYWDLSNGPTEEAALVKDLKLTQDAASLTWLQGRSTIIPITQPVVDEAQSIVQVAFDAGAIAANVDAAAGFDDRYTDVINQTTQSLDYTAAVDKSKTDNPRK